MNNFTGKLISAGGNTKLAKGSEDWLVAGLSLLPHVMGGRQVCGRETVAGCASTCLVHSGRGQMNKVIRARQKRNDLLNSDPSLFYATVEQDIEKFINYCQKKSLKPAVRLNVFSDIHYEARIDLKKFPVQFYDYTKYPERMTRVPSNYHLTLSYSSVVKSYEQKVLSSPANWAVVFDGPLPETFKDRQVINGDNHDLRFLDPSNSVVGLKLKGSKRSNTGFAEVTNA